MKSIEYLKKNGVDLNKCLELFGDVETYSETLKGFHSSVDGKLKQIDNFLKEEDMPNYAIFVHSLKSDCKYFGFMKLANIAFEHEMASKDNDLKFVKEHYQELLDEAHKVKTIVNEYLMDEDGTKNLYSTETEETSFTGISADSIVETQLVEPTVVEELVNTPEPTQIEEEVLEEPEEIALVDTDNEGSLTNIETSLLSDDKEIEEDVILVADDSEVVRIFVKKIFDEKYEIARASNGEEALEIIKQHENDTKIKAILLDLNMPQKDGFAVLDYMTEKDLFKKMPVTVISGDSSKEAISRAFNYEIVDMLNKPFSEQKIKAAVEKTIGYER